MITIETRWRFKEPLACKKELIGATFKCEIADYNAEIRFPISKDKDPYDSEIIGENELYAPFNSNEENLNDNLHQWGMIKDSRGNCCIHSCVFRISIDSIKQFESEKSVIQNNIEDWFNRFYLNCNYINPDFSIDKPDCSGIDIKRDLVFWLVKGKRFLDVGQRKFSLTVYIHPDQFNKI